MLSDDLLCRAILYPKAWPEGVFDINVMLQLNPTEGRSYAISVASRFLLKTILGAHGYGCRAAVASNKRFENTHARKPDPVRGELVNYVGFYDMRCGAIEEIALDHYDVSIRWRLENGENAHFQIELDARGSGSNREQKRDRVAARAQLELCLIGPARHVCECDEALRAELEAIDIPRFPAN